MDEGQTNDLLQLYEIDERRSAPPVAAHIGASAPSTKRVIRSLPNEQLWRSTSFTDAK
jgi:hypothetical protein